VAGNVFRGLVGAIAVGLLVGGCASGGPGGLSTPPTSRVADPTTNTPLPEPSPTPTPTVEPVALEVHCDEDLVLTVSSETVTATPTGVPLLVSSDAPAGAYLNHTTGGDPLPATPTMWMLTAAPGALTLHCSTLEAEGAVVEVTVVDPNGYWSNATLEELGCPMGGIPSWAIEAGEGDTAHEAIEALMANFNEGGRNPEMTRGMHAGLGYPEAADQAWILGNDRTTEIKAVVTKTGSGFTAWPDWMCEPTPWPAEDVD